MTLTLSLHWYGEQPRPDYDGDVAFGFEDYRKTVWGSDALRDVGASIIPALATQDGVYVLPENLDALVREAHAIRDNADAVGSRLEAALVRRDPSMAYWLRRYMDNLLRFIDFARTVGGGVIW